MSFTHLFWTLSAVDALLFFLGGFAIATMRRERRADELGARCARLEEAGRRAALQSSAELTVLRARLEQLDRERRERGAPSLPAATERATTFQSILERLGPAGGMRSAVLGDALGLPIASLGDHPESLAGFCGFLAQAATRASDFLPLGHVRRIVLEDERGATLTACSLRASEIFLATLTVGPGPDPTHMVQVLNDASSFLVERSHA